MQLALETARASSSSLRSLALRRWPRSRLRAPSSLFSLSPSPILPSTLFFSILSFFSAHYTPYSLYPIALPIPTRVPCSIQRAYLYFHLTHIDGGRNREEEEPKLSFQCTWTVETAKYLAKRFASARSKRKPHQLLLLLLLLPFFFFFFLHYTCLVSIEIKGMGRRPWIQRCTNFWPSCTTSRNGIRSPITSWK